MIAAARQFEQQMKMLQGAEQREQAAVRLLCAAVLTHRRRRARALQPARETAPACASALFRACRRLRVARPSIATQLPQRTRRP
ncbi:MAG: hypothetical protein MZW92_72035 [Comamonadaceae bacterium]|nr:hypothetical protein [Comamonadaceae bacterium]